MYLENRRHKHFTVIQAVALAELDGLDDPNSYGERPLIGNDPAKPNEAYFQYVDWVIETAARKGLIVALAHVGEQSRARQLGKDGAHHLQYG